MSSPPVTTLPTSPFPELHALDKKRKVPSLSELLGDASLPVGPSDTSIPLPGKPKLPGISRLPKEQPAEKPSIKSRAAQSLVDMPVDKTPAMREKVAASMADEDIEEFAMPVPPQQDPAARRSTLRSPLPVEPSTKKNTDDDLKDALLPILETTLAKALYAPETGIHTYLEPMLRSTVRRALAEQMDSARQFSEVGPVDRLAWRLSALFTSRSYDEIVFDRTRRFQVEEVYLVRKCDKSLVSYASHDPARHSSTRRVQSTLRMLIRRLQSQKDEMRTTFDLPEKRTVLVRVGKYCLLLAILRGADNALVRADLDYVLRQAEERFGDRLNRSSEAFLQILQPILEGCLLIQSPAPPR
jgi:hypothetical protein